MSEDAKRAGDQATPTVQALYDRIRELEAEAKRYEVASLGMLDPVRVSEVVAQLQKERDESREAARQFFEAASLWGHFPPGGKEVWRQEMLMRWPWLLP